MSRSDFMTDKNKFNFVNDITKENDIIEDVIQEEVEIELTQEEKDRLLLEKLRLEKIRKRRRLRNMIIGMTALTGILFIFAMIWQADWSLMAIGDGLWLVFAIEFAFGWVLFVYNHNIFSPLIYGFKSFGLMFVGKRPKTDYYSYMKNIQDNQIEAYFFIMFFVSAFIVFIPAFIILLILL